VQPFVVFEVGAEIDHASERKGATCDEDGEKEKGKTENCP
jgi:hypothetical protein